MSATISKFKVFWRTSANDDCFYLKQFNVIFIMKELPAFYNLVYTSHQVKYYQFFIVEIVFESVNLLQI